MQSSLSRAGAALLLASLGAACGGSGSPGSIEDAPTDGGNAADGGNKTDGGTTSPQAVNLGTASDYVILAKA